MDPAENSEILGLVIQFNLIILIFRFFRGGRDDVMTCEVLVTWHFYIVVLVLCFRIQAFQLQLRQSKPLLLFGIWCTMSQEFIPTIKMIWLLLLFKNLALSVLSLGWLWCPPWLTPSLGSWLVWCSWGPAWGMGSIGLSWYCSRFYQSIVSHLVMCHPSILVVY